MDDQGGLGEARRHEATMMGVGRIRGVGQTWGWGRGGVE